MRENLRQHWHGSNGQAAWFPVLVTVLCFVAVLTWGGEVTAWTFTHIFG